MERKTKDDVEQMFAIRILSTQNIKIVTPKKNYIDVIYEGLFERITLFNLETDD